MEIVMVTYRKNEKWGTVSAVLKLGEDDVEAGVRNALKPIEEQNKSSIVDIIDIDVFNAPDGKRYFNIHYAVISVKK